MGLCNCTGPFHLFRTAVIPTNLEQIGLYSLSTEGAFPLSTDSMLLGTFASPKPGSRVCDLGCGSGVIGLLLLSRCGDLQITGMDCNADALHCAEGNIARNQLSDRFLAVQADLRDLDTLPNGAFAYAVSNPPYFSSGSGAIRTAHSQAASEDSCSMDQLFQAADRVLQWSGRFALVHRPERLSDLCCCGRAHHLELKRLRMVRHHSGAAPSLLLCEFRKGGHPGVQYDPDLILHHPDGSPSPEMKAIYHMEG
jgi:tRNA1(Val) A37 N6-methylase TrmN6